MRKLFFLLLVVSVYANGQTGYYITGSDNTKLYVQEFGTGKPVVILAGGPGLNAIYLESMYKKVSDSFRCIVLDQRGTGRSVLQSVDSITISMANYVNDLEALRKHLKLDRLTLIGHSWGGMLIQEYASRHPNQIEKILLLSPGGPTNKFFSYFGDNITFRLHEEDFKEAALADSLKQSSLKAIWPGYFFDRKRALATKATVTSEVHGQKGVNSIALRSFAALQNERVSLLKNYKGAVYILQGRQDPIGESTLYEIKEVLPQAKIYIIEKAGHFPWLENEAQVKKFFETLYSCLK